MRNTLAALVAGVVLIASCDGNGPGDQPAEETDGVPTAAANQQSDAGCPAPITVGSGLGQQQVGTVALVASGIGSGAAIAQLLKEFNRRAADEGFRYWLYRITLPRKAATGREGLEHAAYSRFHAPGYLIGQVQAKMGGR